MNLGKRILLGVALLFSCACAFSGCGEKQDDGKLSVVCTIFPQYDWVRQITEGDDDISLTVLETSGADLHNYQPTVKDLSTIYQCDLFLYVGGVEDVLKSSSANKDMKTVNLLEALGDSALDEEEVPGAEEEEDHDHEEMEKDEHVWLSLKNASALCKKITAALSELNPEKGSLYESNLAAYTEKLSDLDDQFASAVSSAARKVLLFADRFPFRYLCEDYSLSYYAAFSGCSAESEASFATIANLANAVDDNALPYVLVLEGSDRKIAQSVIGATTNKNQTVLEVNSLQAVTGAQISDGVTYLSLMEENLNVFRKALN